MEPGPPLLVLASASPRRIDMLRAAGIPHAVHPTDVDESRLPGEPPEQMVARLSRSKVDAAAARYPDRAVLGADTLVVAKGAILGKPPHEGAARQMLMLLSGATHEVLTAYHLYVPVYVPVLVRGRPAEAKGPRAGTTKAADRTLPTGQEAPAGQETPEATTGAAPKATEDRRITRVVRTEVDVRPLGDADLAGYLASDEWRGKAGAYAIQGRFACFVRALRGSHESVVGLPLCALIEDLAAEGLLPPGWPAWRP